MTQFIYPTVLCGGSGTRLWPLSRKSYPKQFSPLLKEKSLFQRTITRISNPQYESPILLTNSDFRFIVNQQLKDIGIDDANILIEPSSKNTAPAILAAALYLMKSNPDALMLVVPSDHIIPDTDAFNATVSAGVAQAQAGQLITFGIMPTSPETGYGYLELENVPENFSAQPHHLKAFVEKPDQKTAQSMLKTEKYLWNAGIFLFSARSLIEAFEKHAPDLIPHARDAIETAEVDLNFLRLDPKSWDNIPDISIDYAIMEHANNIMAIPYKGKWSDLGSWEAVWQNAEPDKKTGTVVSKNATAIECENTLLRSESDNQEIVGIGLKNIIAIAMPDAVLVTDRKNTQKVKLAVDKLKQKEKKQAESFPRDHRPWGWFETLSLGNRFQVKQIMVYPGSALSLQSHVHRAEHWIVVHGVAKVTIGKKEQLVSENQSVYIPLGETHRLENPGKVDLHLIEVQTGSYLGEDDIIRYEDIYARSSQD